jgi:SAM-dependent methyltransferase
MSFFRRQPTSGTPLPSKPVSPAAKVSVADVLLAYRLILKREADPSGLETYTQRIREGLTLEELIRSLLDSPERAERIQRGDAEQTGADGRAADASLINPKEVMQRYSVAELNETADEYYRVMQDPDLTLRKPFQSVNETPEMLENLGALLGGLHLGKAMTVLDFGAGTCWLSRLIAQLNCGVICCDPSAVALDIGRRFFEEHPPLTRELLPPRFLQFDGHRLELADESVDRIICFDAFHHVPNQAEVLRELGRVLKPGGIAGFSEPGRYHSRAPQSQYDMRNHRVLENDIDLNEIFSLAESAGSRTPGCECPRTRACSKLQRRGVIAVTAFSRASSCPLNALHRDCSCARSCISSAWRCFSSESVFVLASIWFLNISTIGPISFGGSAPGSTPINLSTCSGAIRPFSFA